MPADPDLRGTAALQDRPRLCPGWRLITPDDLARIKDWLINPVEAREAAMDKPDSLVDTRSSRQTSRRSTDSRHWTTPAWSNCCESAGFAMSLADLRFIRDWFRGEGRDPTWTELRVLDTYWSDHCRHTTFLTRIECGRISVRTIRSAGRSRQSWQTYLDLRQSLHGSRLAEKPACLMDLATLAMKELRRQGKLDDLDESPEINACSIKVTIPVDGRPEDYLVMFKNETHNHPTEIEPFGGAATCLGGAIRDPLSGRSYVYQAMRVTGSGDPTVPVSQTLPGKLPQRKITTTAAAGYSSYGNQIGLATGQVEEIYHPGLYRQAHGDRRRDRRGPGQPGPAGSPGAGRPGHPPRRPDRPRRLRRRHRLLQGP